MPNTFLKIAAALACIAAVHPAQAAGSSAAFASLKQFAMTTTGSIPSAPAAGGFCLAADESAPTKGTVAFYAHLDMPSIDL